MQNQDMVFIFMAIAIVAGILIPMIIGMWKVFEKANFEGWKCLIPIYNVYIMCKIAQKPGWWTILCIIPYVSAVFQIIINIEIAQKFNRSAGFGIGLAFLPFIFFPILGNSDDEYLPNKNNDISDHLID